MAWVADRLDLGPGRVVVDLAAGTGKLTRLLVPTGARVIAVEPQAEMRGVLERAVPGAEALEGTAEELPLEDGSADAVTVASAFHWFEPPEYAEFRHEQRFGADALVERVASISYVALLPDEERAEFLARVKELGERREAPFSFPYVTQVWVSPRS